MFLTFSVPQLTLNKLTLNNTKTVGQNMLNTVSAYIRNAHFSSERALLPSWDRVLCQVQEWQGIHSGRPDVFTRKSSVNERKINSTEYVLTRFNVKHNAYEPLLTLNKHHQKLC